MGRGRGKEIGRKRKGKGKSKGIRKNGRVGKEVKLVATLYIPAFIMETQGNCVF